MTPIVVEMLPTTIWVEKDILGRAFVVCQHEGMGAFDYAQFNYQYGYTDNRSVHQAAVDLAQRLGAAEPVKVRNRAVEWIDRPSPVSAPQPITSDQSPAMRKAQDGTAPHPKEK